jgi:ParB family transcriptional regulator, chromosome partitioning protein
LSVDNPTEKVGKLEKLTPKEIRPNPKNPRMDFPEDELDELAASIDEIGILVPVSVYVDPSDDHPESPYVLMDGERRWICSTRLGLSEMPAIVMEKPDETQNLLTMFNIHMVREPWDEMPTAWALEDLSTRIGERDPKSLELLTGLSVEQIKRLQLAVTLPEEYQQMIYRHEVPINYFYDIERYVLSPMSRKRPEVYERYGPDKIRASFVDKRRTRVTTDTVELRKMGPIISIAAEEAGTDGTSDLDEAIEELITVPEKTIGETYEQTVEMVVEADRFAKQCELLIRRFDRLVERATDGDERALVVAALTELKGAIESRLDG